MTSILFVFFVAPSSAAIYYLIQWYLQSQRLRSLPRIGLDPGVLNLHLQCSKNEFFAHGQKLLEQGYKQYKNTPYVIQTCDNERIVVPDRFIEDLKNLPDTVISFKEELLDRFMGRWTRMDAVRGSNVHRDITRGQLTRGLASLVPDMRGEAMFAIGNALRDVGEDEFTPIKASSLIFAAIGQITSRIIVHEPLSRDSEWIITILGYTASVAVFSMEMRRIPRSIRPFAYYYLDSGRKLRRDVERIKSYLVPVIRKRQDMLGATGAQKKEAPQDIVQWLVESARGQDRSPDAIVMKILFLIVAAMHTSAITTIHALYDVVSRPDYIADLEAEARAEVARDGWSYKTSLRLRKMDAFLKESGRVNSAGVVSFQRLVLKPITLSTGFTIPAQTHICAASDARSRDPNLYHDPLEFQPLRFYKNAETATDSDGDSAHLFSSVAGGDSWFGIGRQACPGRWYATAQIKMVLCELVLNYDMKWPDGQKSRPANWVKDEKTGPDMEQMIWVRRKS